MPPNLMSKRPLPMNPHLIEDLTPHTDMPHPISTEPLPEPLILEPPVEPLVPIPWNIHHCQYSSMEEFIEHVIQNLVSWPVDDLDSPMLDVPPLEPEPVMPYLLDSPEGHMHTLSPDESPTEPWQQWLDYPDSPISCKHSLLPSILRSWAYVGCIFHFYLLTKLFPSHDQPPIHFDHMTNHLTSHLTIHMTSHMPSSHLFLKCHLPYVTCSQITCASPDTPLPNST